MKVLCIGDLHIQKKNMNIVKCFAVELLAVLDRERVETVVFLGDTLHTMNIVNVHCMNVAVDLFDRVLAHSSKVSVKVLVGNHDFVGPNEYLSKNHWLVALNKREPRLEIVDTVTVDDANGILYMPYVPKNMFWKAVAPFLLTSEQQKRIRYIMCHQEFLNCMYEFGNVKSETGDDIDDLALEFDDDNGKQRLLIISGHIHKKQWLQSSNANAGAHKQIDVYYVGTPYQTRFNEEADKTVAVLDTAPAVDAGEIREIALKLPKMLTLEQNVMDLYAKRVKPIQFEKLNMYKLVMHVESPTQAQRFMKTDVYKGYAKHATVMFEYDTVTVMGKDESKPIVTLNNFKSLFHDRIKDNKNMANLFAEILGSQ